MNAGERAYSYAKACGIIGKSFVGKRIAILKKLHTLTEFDRLIFSGTQHEPPGRDLLIHLEHRILRRTAQQILSVINSYVNPPELLIRQLRSCEYADLKNCLHHIAAGRPVPELVCDIGRFRTVRFEAYPDIEAMINNTEFAFILGMDINAVTNADYDFTRLETELDMQYYTLLVRSMSRLSVSDRLIAERILTEEISLRNCIWAFRLRIYYHKTIDETEKYLMSMKMHQSYSPDIIPGITAKRPDGIAFVNEINLDLEARQMLDFPLDSRSPWKGWRWEKLLNSEKPGREWAADPRFFQNAASQYIYHLALRCFRRMPFSMSAIFCYIKLKQFEEDLLTSVIEGLAIGMTGTEVVEMFEAWS
ncbi:MAG: V-type ATPase subunit [Treponema sp.]|nr:V-type ATPase subunit [Treponema sp.]